MISSRAVDLKVVALVPARAGSVGLKNKNVSLLNDTPMFVHSVLAALDCEEVDDVFVSSDSGEYLQIAEKYGAKIHLRSVENSSDTASMKSVLIEFIEWLKGIKVYPDCILVLYPTYPLRNPGDLSTIIGSYSENRQKYPDGLIGLKQSSGHPYLHVSVNDFGYINDRFNPDMNTFYRRQDYPPAWIICHWACLVATSAVANINAQCFSEKSFPMLLSNDIIDVDYEFDLETAKSKLISS